MRHRGGGDVMPRLRVFVKQPLKVFRRLAHEHRRDDARGVDARAPGQLSGDLHRGDPELFERAVLLLGHHRGGARPGVETARRQAHAPSRGYVLKQRQRRPETLVNSGIIVERQVDVPERAAAERVRHETLLRPGFLAYPAHDVPGFRGGIGDADRCPRRMEDLRPRFLPG